MSTNMASSPDDPGETQTRQTSCRLAVLLHHVTMFAIGCAIGMVLMIFYTSFLPIGGQLPVLPSQHRTVMAADTQSDRLLRAMSESDIGQKQSPGVESDPFAIFGLMAAKSDPEAIKASFRNIETNINLKRVRRSTSSTPNPPDDRNSSSDQALNASTTSVTSTTPTQNSTGTDCGAGMNCTCKFTNVAMKNVCKLPFQLEQLGLENINLLDVIGTVLSAMVVAQWDSCSPGRWCQPSENIWNLVSQSASRWSDGNYQAQICPLLDCLNHLPATTVCEDEKRSLVIRTVTLLCSMPMSRDTQSRDMACAKHVIMMTHVNMADLNRPNKLTAQDVCNWNQSLSSVCSNGCKELFVEFADLEFACDNYQYFIKNHEPWKWYFRSSIKQNCDVESALGHKETSGFTFAFVGKYRTQIIISASVASAILLCLIIVTSVYFWRRRRIVYKRASSLERECAEMEGLLVT